MKLLREPLVHFLFIGAAIYLAYGLTAASVEDKPDNTLVVSAGEIEWLQTAWQKRWSRPPTAEELAGLIEQHIKETVLYREALAMGLDKDDVIVRRRMAQKLEFLAQDLVALIPPSDEELLTWFEEHRQSYEKPVRLTFTQIFFDPDKRGEATLNDAKAIKATLMAQSDGFDQAGALGDGLMLQNDYSENTQADIEKLFGSDFAESVMALSPGQWHGPLLSGYGVHLVYVHSISEPPPPDFAAVRERVAQDWEDAKREALNKQFYAELLDRYTIVIEEPAEDDKVAALQEKTP